MKLKAIVKFKDLQTQEFIEEGTVIERTEKRGKDLIQKGMVQALEQATNKDNEFVSEEVEAVNPSPNADLEPVAENKPSKPKGKKKK